MAFIFVVNVYIHAFIDQIIKIGVELSCSILELIFMLIYFLNIFSLILERKGRGER